MKNTILSFITGMALGSIAIGIGVIGLNNLMAAIMIAVGMCWMVPFVYANKERFYWIFK